MPDMSLQDMVAEIVEIADEILNEWEHTFITDMSEKFDKFGSDTFVSPKQEQIIRRLYQKACDSPH